MYQTQVPGSKPRKFIKRTILTNPSLISVSVTSLLDPENNSLPKIYDAIERRQQAVAQNENRIINMSPPKYQSEEKMKRTNRQLSTKLDSLQQAQKEFLKRKMSHNQLKIQSAPRSPLLIKKQLGKQISYMSQRSNSSGLLNSFNYKSSTQIKQKQSKPYNIISNLS